jgi:SAM-dependent methyltransferase
VRRDNTALAAKLGPGLKDFVETMIPAGSHCLDVTDEPNFSIRRWLLDHQCEYVVAHASQVSALPFEDKSFEAALLIDLVHRLVEPRQAAVELCRVLRPGGVLVVTSPNVSYWRHRLARNPPHHRPQSGAFSPASLRWLLLEGGFSLVCVEGQGGSVIQDLPVARRFWKGHASTPYRVAERLFPSLLGSQVNAFAVRGTTLS